MDCLQYRRKLLEEPYRTDADFLAHEDTCRTCADHGRQVRADEADLRAALYIEPPPELAGRIRLTAKLDGQRTEGRKRAWWLSAAAGLLVAVAAFISSLALTPLDRTNVALAQSVLAHLDEEAGHLHDPGPVRSGKVSYLFRQFGAELQGELGDVSFAAICLMRRKTGVHLVLPGAQGPVTVFFMPDERPEREVAVDSHRFRGRILPTAWGSIAVIGAPGEPLDGVAERLRDAVHWPSGNAAREPLPLLRS